MSARRPPTADGLPRFPASKLTTVAFASVLLGGATAWIGAREERAAATRQAAPQPASAMVDEPGQLAPGGYVPSRIAPALSRPQPTTRTRAS